MDDKPQMDRRSIAYGLLLSIPFWLVVAAGIYVVWFWK